MLVLADYRRHETARLRVGETVADRTTGALMSTATVVEDSLRPGLHRAGVGHQ